MLAAALIVFREMLEAGLILGILLVATRGLSGRMPWIIGGIFVGVLCSIGLAAFTNVLANAFSGMGIELFNAAVLGTAVLMLAWHQLWIARHSQSIVAEVRAISQEIVSGARSLLALATVACLTVLREGFEVVLLLYGLAISEGSSASYMFFGAFCGLLLGGGASAAIYWGLLALPSRYLFKVTNILIAFLAASMASQAVLYLHRAEVVNIFKGILWDSSFLLTDGTLPAQILQILIGYQHRPSQMQMFVYLLTLLAFFLLNKFATPKPPVKAAPARCHP